MGRRIRKFIQFTLNDDLGELSHAEWVVYWSIVLTPLWWLLGIQTFLFMFIPLYLFIRGFDLDRILSQSLPLSIWAWLVVCIISITLALLALANLGLPPAKILPTLITFLKGYFLICSCLLMPFWHRIRLKVVTRAVCWMAFSYVVTLTIQVICLFGGVWKDPIYPPLAKLIPGDKLSLLVKPAVWQKFFGVNLPRTSLYMADPPIPGVCGLLCYFMCRGETNDRLRRLGITGSIIALIVSQSRLAWVCFPLTVLVSAWFQQFTARQMTLWGMTGISTMSAMLGMTIKEMISKPMEVFTSARAESSADRALVVGKTLEAWQQSPWFGWGITQGVVKWYIYEIALGSFSTYASVLYHQGIFGFFFFILALLATLWDCTLAGLRGNLAASRAVGALLGLYFLIEGLPITWISVYFWFFFVWVGSIYAEAYAEEPVPPGWHHLST